MLGIVIAVVTGNSPWVQLYAGSAPDTDFANCYPSDLEFTFIPIACFLWDFYGRYWNAGTSWHDWLDYEQIVDF